MKKEEYNGLVKDIGLLLEEGRRKALQSVNSIIVQTYWEIGRKIVEFEQSGEDKAKYGSGLLEMLSKNLRQKYGKGFSVDNLEYMRRFYTAFKNSETLSRKLSWSHYVEILAINDNLERAFYEKQCLEENWSVRELKRQIGSGLIHRILAGKKQNGILLLSQKGQALRKPEDIIKDPYVFEFLKLPPSYSEKQLEDKIINNLQMFLLELGKGFSFVARQYRMQIGRKQFYADLVFYNKILRCYVLIDLKIKGGYSGVGQMNLYLNYFKSHVNLKEDNEPIGIILLKEGKGIEVKYALGGLSSRIFASKYMLNLPSIEDLRKATGINA
ncbi:MAG: PDDEXK nuclease domain-containing protein [Candidatus Nanoarchaeia archaeon]|nr:PDDEXK nuclease domain-containing protein [Candidatus Nanoarchaeia archaeon]